MRPQSAFSCARARREHIVPMDTPRSLAASVYEYPWTSTSTIAIRNASASASSALPMSSRSSVAHGRLDKKLALPVHSETPPAHGFLSVLSVFASLEFVCAGVD